MRIVAITVMGIVTLVSSAWAQSLGDLAAQERERRKGKKTHVITEKDLVGARGKSFSQPEGSATESGASNASARESASSEKKAGEKDKPKTEEEIRAEKRAEWEKRANDARTRADQLAKQVDELQLEANNAANSAFGSGRARLLERLDKAKQDLAAAQQLTEQLENERRQAGY